MSGHMHRPCKELLTREYLILDFQFLLFPFPGLFHNIITIIQIYGKLSSGLLILPRLGSTTNSLFKVKWNFNLIRGSGQQSYFVTSLIASCFKILNWLYFPNCLRSILTISSLKSRTKSDESYDQD